MKKLAVIVFILTLGGSAAAQSPRAALDAAKNVRLLEATREDVRKIFANDIFPPSDASAHEESFYLPEAVVAVTYASGGCTGEADDWNAPEWTVTGISVQPKDFVRLADLGLDYSKFRKETPHRLSPKFRLYADKKAGLWITTSGDRVVSVAFSPSAKNYGRLCERPEVREYYASRRLVRDPATRNSLIDLFESPDVTALDLSRTEIVAGDDARIAVTTTVSDTSYTMVLYQYYVAAGKIVGRGPEVVWDLSGVRPGVYRITAVADDGCGPCGKYVTRTVVVKE
ncbi:MAG: hypothetical protein JSS81_12465 [Acidobacteria bacterium]|nr:hypothetical protein [Acidobacteriota bacterium]